LNTAPLRVVAGGMATALGLTAPASLAAMRARLRGFGETRFLAHDGSRITGAEVPIEPRREGLDRLVQLVVAPIGECLEQAAGLRPSEIVLLLCIAEPDRAGRLPHLDTLLQAVEAALALRFHPASRIVPMGRVGGAVGIREACKLFHERVCARVIVAGVDSYLQAATLASFGERRRLLSLTNSNGFIPGEAGAVVLLAADGAVPGLAIRSLGLAIEKATIESEEPLRGEGLADAYRQALGAIGLGLQDIAYRLADLSGEQYWFKETAFAMARVMRVRREFQELWHPADTIGEIGAAAVPAMLNMALDAARKGYAPGELALAQAANDDGRRATMVLDGRGIGR
jgi:3-oxoacyl-[acyl-carrier-protein] synthase-1